MFLQLALAATLFVSALSTTAHAADATSTRDIPVGGSGQMEMVGTIEPTILSVTMPSFVLTSATAFLPRTRLFPHVST